MILRSTIDITPSVSSFEQEQQPTNFFKKLWLSLSGAKGPVIQSFAYNASSVLQNIHRAMKSKQINNIIRLSLDDRDIYVDTEGKTDDMVEAVDKFRWNVEDIESDTFKKLELVFEHNEDTLHYLLEVTVNKRAKVGIAPINIEITAVLNTFKKAPNETTDELKSRMVDIFSSQEKYDAVVDKSKRYFNEFCNGVLMALMANNIGMAILRTNPEVSIIRNRTASALSKGAPQRSTTSGRRDYQHYDDYYGWDDFLLYAYLWNDLSYHNAIHYHDVQIIDENYTPLMNIDTNGVDTSQYDAFNPNVDYAPVHDDSISIFSEETSRQLEVDTSDYQDNSSDSLGSSSDSTSDSSSDSGSSCSSCSSCSSD